jgi:hypothetical protein
MNTLEQYASSDELADMVDTLHEEASQLSHATGRRDDDESHDDDGLSFRLYIRPDGSLELNTGEPCYDTDHRGGCGAGSVSSHDDDDTILEILLDALADAYFSARDAASDDAASDDDDDDDDAATLSLDHPNDEGTHTLAVEHSTRDGWQRHAYGVNLGEPTANGWRTTLVELRGVYFRLVSYAMEPPCGMAGTRYIVDGHIVSHYDAASLRWLADMLTRHGVSL